MTSCLTKGCAAATRALAVVRANTLGTEDKKDGIGRHHGKKLEKIIELITEKIPADEKVLLFVQFPDLGDKVSKLLEESGETKMAWLAIVKLAPDEDSAVTLSSMSLIF